MTSAHLQRHEDVGALGESPKKIIIAILSSNMMMESFYYSTISNLRSPLRESCLALYNLRHLLRSRRLAITQYIANRQGGNQQYPLLTLRRLAAVAQRHDFDRSVSVAGSVDGQESTAARSSVAHQSAHACVLLLLQRDIYP